jgi:putative membrane protein
VLVGPAALLARRGVLVRELDVVPHARTQSLGLRQGPLQRRLGLASVHQDTTPGPVNASAAHRPAAEARALVDAEVERARVSRSLARPDRWMSPPSGPATPTVTR